jgi:hypothetical protein
MAKKFVRGITDIKEINEQDFDTNNVNDLLSDGEHNYIHRKKGDSEEYHNLTNNLKIVVSDDTDLLEVTNDNETTNSATLHPKHDAKKEQSIESTRNTITIEHGTNATSETTKVDTNPEKVLEHDNLKTGDGLSVTKNGENSTIKITPSHKPSGTNLDTVDNGIIRGNEFISSLSNTTTQRDATYFTFSIDDNTKIQFTMRPALSVQGKAVIEYRFIYNNSTTEWRQIAIDTNELTSFLAQKQNKLQGNASIGIAGTGLRQLYALKQNYNTTGGLLKTHVKSLSLNTNINVAEEEFNFIVKIDKGVSSVNFTLNSHDKDKFTSIINTYGENNTVCISGCVFTLSGSTLTVSTANNTEQNYVVTFSNII